MSGGFQPVGFQGPPGFQQTGNLEGEITQSIPSFTQSLVGTSAAVAPPSEPGGGAFLGPGFMSKNSWQCSSRTAGAKGR